MADRDVQVPADENLPAAQVAAVIQLPPPPPAQNPEQPANPNPPNAAAEDVTLEVCSMFDFIHLSHTCFCISYFQFMLCPASKRVAL